MKSIIRHIEYLLTRHDCVIVPNLGAFVRQYKSSTLSDETNTISSPTYSIGFNSDVNHNDALLASSVMRASHVSFEIALRFINQEVASIKSQLTEEGSASLGRLGILKSSPEGLVTFEAFNKINHFCDTYGLSDLLTLAPLVSEEEIEEDESEVRPINRFVKVCRIAASIVILLALSVVLTTPVITDTHVDPASIAEAFEVTTPSNDNAIIENSQELLIAMPHSEGTNRSSVETEPVTTLNEGKYCVVVSSLESERRAQKFISEHSDDNLQIIESDGKYRVYIDRSDDFAEMNKIRRDIDEKYPGAWIYNTKK